MDRGPWSEMLPDSEVAGSEEARLYIVHDLNHLDLDPAAAGFRAVALCLAATSAYAKKDDRRVTQIVSTMLPLLCGAGLLFLVGGWTFAWYIDRVLNIAPERLWDARLMLALLILSIAITLPLAPFGVGFFVVSIRNRIINRVPRPGPVGGLGTVPPGIMPWPSPFTSLPS